MNLAEFSEVLSEVASSGAGDMPPENIAEYLNPVDKVKLRSLIDYINIIRGLEFSDVIQKLDLQTYANQVKQERGEPQDVDVSTFNKTQWTGLKSYVVGYKFEQLIEVLFEDSKLFSVQNRIVSTSAEIDYLVNIHGPWGQMFPIFHGHTSLIGEGKCHVTNPKSEWVNKLTGVMNSHHTTVSIIFVFSPPKAAAKPFRESIKDNFRGVTPLRVIPFGITQFERVLAGESFIKILEQQYSLAKLGTAALKI